MTNTQLLEQALDLLHKLEDRTNYEIKNLGEAVTLLQAVNIKKKWEQSKIQNPRKELK